MSVRRVIFAFGQNVKPPIRDQFVFLHQRLHLDHYFNRKIKIWRTISRRQLLHLELICNGFKGIPVINEPCTSFYYELAAEQRVERFENDALWKRCFLVWTWKWCYLKNGDVIQIDTTGRQPTRTVTIQNGEQPVPCGFSLDDRCSVDGRKRYENDKCGPKSFWKRSKTAPFSFENGSVWTGP